jgi:hypothetical protein
MKTLLRSSLFALALFGSYAAIADGSKLSGVPIFAPRPSCICQPPSQQLGLR